MEATKDRCECAEIVRAACQELKKEDGLTAAMMQLVLAEKRTSLSVLRTGVTIGLVPLSVTTVLVTLSRFYQWLDNLHLLLPLYVGLLGLAGLSFFLIGRSLRQIRREDRLLAELKDSSDTLRRLLEAA
jgi:hypothetical protein